MIHAAADDSLHSYSYKSENVLYWFTYWSYKVKNGDIKQVQFKNIFCLSKAIIDASKI